MHHLPDKLSQVLAALARFCAARGVAAWLVGGAARDLALGRVPGDLDVAVDADGVALARAFADESGAAFVALDDERGTGRVVIDPHGTERLIVDLVQLRAPTLEEDLRLRDFTLNAMALPLSDPPSFSLHPSSVVDPCGGLADLHARQLRPCGPDSLRDDPLRILRAVRLAAELHLRVTPDLHAAIRAAAPLITQVAAERVRDELLKLLNLPGGGVWLRYLDDTRVLTRIFPELEPARDCTQPRVHFLPVLAHILETVVCVEWLLAGLHLAPGTWQMTEQAKAGTSTLPVAVQTHPELGPDLPYAEHLRAHFTEELAVGRTRAALLKLATLLHDVSKPQTKQEKPDGGVSFYGHQDLGAEVAATVGRRLRLNRAEVAYVALVVREHMRPGQLRSSDVLTRRAVVRFFHDTGDAGPDVLLHELADHLAARGPQVDPRHWRAHLVWTSIMLDAHWGRPPERRVPLVNGNDLMATLGIGPGKMVGVLLREIAEAQAAGEITTREAALALAQELLARQA